MGKANAQLRIHHEAAKAQLAAASQARHARKLSLTWRFSATNFLEGKCDKGDKCKYHHNGPCLFYAEGNCKRGDECVYAHSSNVAAPTPLFVPVDSDDPAKPNKTKKDGDNA